jgi:anti-sigma factor RsiW
VKVRVFSGSHRANQQDLPQPTAGESIMNCDSAIAAMASRWNGEISIAEERALEHHLSTCAACAEEFARLTPLWQDLEHLPVVEPSAALKLRFDDTLAQYIAERQPVRRSWSWWPKLPSLQFAIAACALLFGLVAGAVWQRSAKEPRRDRQPARRSHTGARNGRYGAPPRHRRDRRDSRAWTMSGVSRASTPL